MSILGDSRELRNMEGDNCMRMVMGLCSSTPHAEATE